MDCQYLALLETPAIGSAKTCTYKSEEYRKSELSEATKQRFLHRWCHLSRDVVLTLDIIFMLEYTRWEYYAANTNEWSLALAPPIQTGILNAQSKSEIVPPAPYSPRVLCNAVGGFDKWSCEIDTCHKRNVEDAHLDLLVLSVRRPVTRHLLVGSGGVDHPIVFADTEHGHQHVHWRVLGVDRIITTFLHL